jgi:hypothetical protein
MIPLRNYLLIVITVFAIMGCSNHEVDTVEEWCEQINGVDLEDKYLPAWAIIFSVSFNGDAIRDDYAKMLNTMYMEKAEGRMPRMSWREGTALHLINLSSLFVVEPEKFIDEWRAGIEKAKAFAHEDPVDTCIYGTVASLFDSLHIHSMTPDALGKEWTDDVTVIMTDREKRFGEKRL